MMTETILETSVSYTHLTRLIAREDFIEFRRRENSGSYIGNEMSGFIKGDKFLGQLSNYQVFKEELYYIDLSS